MRLQEHDQLNHTSFLESSQPTATSSAPCQSYLTCFIMSYAPRVGHNMSPPTPTAHPVNWLVQSSHDKEQSRPRVEGARGIGVRQET
jgi:hypothetical protein